MADKKKTERNVVPSEIGSTGVYAKGFTEYFEDSIRELTFPHSLITYDKMAMNVSIASALSAVTTIANAVPIYIEAFDQTPQHIKRADFVMSCFDDMENNDTLESVIQKALTFNKYGFAVLEKVFRRRRFKNGSKYDDGKIGLKYLPMRKQHSIVDFKWDDDYREFLGVYQNTTSSCSYSWIHQGNGRITLSPTLRDATDKFIPKKNILLFKTDTSTDLPQGVSPLYYCYEGWRELQKHKDMENIAASKNMNGILVGRAPEEYLSEDADPTMKAAGKAFKDGLTKVTINEQGCVVLPSTRSDDANGSLEWDVTTLQSSSSHITSISSIVQRIQNEILQLMFADVLRSGDEAVKDTATNKKSLLNRLVEIRIKEILRVLNTDLIPELFRRNGWDDTKCPQLRYGELEEVDMAVFAKAMQQLKATKLIPITPTVINRVLEVMGFTYRVPDDMSKEELDELLGVEDKLDSKSGSGLASKTGGLNGQGDEVSESDNSADNLSNK